MPRPPASPMGDKELAKLQDAKAKLTEAKAQIMLAKQAGLDVTDQEKQVDDGLAQTARFMQVYFPGE